MKHLEVVAAIIINNDEILCMQRNVGKFDYVSLKFEFPGGKIEEGETKPEALMRELREEMDFVVSIDESNYFMSVNHEYPDFTISMHSYICKVEDRKFKMKEHKSFVWSKVEDLSKLDWAPADWPIVKKLMEERL